jgi:hypothetical protein
MIIEKFISPFIESQFPQFYREDGDQFIAFVKAYYEWMESNGNILDKSRSLLDYRDIDTTLQEYITHFKQKYINSLPENVISDKRLLMKHILELYRSKGTDESYKFLFKMLFDEEIEIYVPKDYIFKTSDGDWVVKKYIEVSDNPYLKNMVGEEIYSSTTDSRAVVDEYYVTRVNNKLINVLFLNNIRGNFKYGERIFCQQIPEITIDNAPLVFGSLSSVSITNGGLGYKVGDVLNIQNSGIGGLARVSSTRLKNGEVEFTLIKGGTGFSLDAVVNVDGLQLPINKIYSANPVVINTAAPHKLKDGNSLRIDYATNGFEPLNTGTYSYFVQVVNSTAFTPYTDALLTTAFDGSVLGSLLEIKTIEKTNPITLTGMGLIKNQANPDGVLGVVQHGLDDGQQIAIQNVQGATELNDKVFFAKSLNLTDFTLYRDKNLTIPVDATGFNDHIANTGYVYTKPIIYDSVPIKTVSKSNPIKVVTGSYHYLNDHEFIRIDGVKGTTELNDINYNFYVKRGILPDNPTPADIIVYNTTLYLYHDQNLAYPVDGSSFTDYISDGFIFKFPFYFGNTGYTYLNTGGEGATFKVGSLVNKEVLKINTDRIHDYVPTVLDDTENGYMLTVTDVVGTFSAGNNIKMDEIEVKDFDVVFTSQTLMSNGEILSNTSLGVFVLEVNNINGGFSPSDHVYQTDDNTETGTVVASGNLFFSTTANLNVQDAVGIFSNRNLYNSNLSAKICKLNIDSKIGSFNVYNKIFQTSNDNKKGIRTATGIIYYSSDLDVRVKQLTGTFVANKKIFNTASNSSAIVCPKLSLFVGSINGTFNVSDSVYQTADNTKTGIVTATGIVRYSSGNDIEINQLTGTFTNKKMFNSVSNSNGIINTIYTSVNATELLKSYCYVIDTYEPSLSNLTVMNTDSSLLTLKGPDLNSEYLIPGTKLISDVSFTELTILRPSKPRTITATADLIDVLTPIIYANNQNGYFFSGENITVVGRNCEATISHANPAVVTTTHVKDANFTILENDPIRFNTNGGLPDGIQDYQYYPDKIYYAVDVAVVPGFPDLHTFKIAETPSGSPIATTSDGFGTHNVTNLTTGATATITHNRRMTDWFQFGIPLPYPFDRKNLDTRISDLNFVDKEVGTIASLTQINPGTGYTLDPTVSVIEPLVKDLGYYELFGPYKGTWKGFNASITAKAVYASGIVTSIDVIDSGFGYDRDQVVELMSNSNPYAVTGTTVVDLNGKAAGYWKNSKSFISDQMYLQDSDYYQNYSYEIIAERMLHTYEKYVKDLVHPVGMKLFGRYIVRSELDISTTDNVVDNMILIKPKEEYYHVDRYDITNDNTTIFSDNEVI